mmetsp:Transcript_23215/g.33322  ORF Transcript_23215/g.33322 Transcript_23215/m.33322 type:complete len:95 (-) Transcript_23215:21-305(-)
MPWNLEKWSNSTESCTSHKSDRNNEKGVGDMGTPLLVWPLHLFFMKNQTTTYRIAIIKRTNYDENYFYSSRIPCGDTTVIVPHGRWSIVLSRRR